MLDLLNTSEIAMKNMNKPWKFEQEANRLEKELTKHNF